MSSNNTNNFATLNTIEIIQLLSCFTNVTVNEKVAAGENFTDTTDMLGFVLIKVRESYNYYYDLETKSQLYFQCDYPNHYDLIPYIEMWCLAEDEQQSKNVIYQAQSDKGIFLGEFIKAILKIMSIVKELEQVGETLGLFDLTGKMQDCDKLLLKFVVTNQSLYV